MYIHCLVFLLLQSAEIPQVPPELLAARAAREFVNAQIEFEVIPGPTMPQPERNTHWCRSTYTPNERASELHTPNAEPLASVTDHAIVRGLQCEGGFYWNCGGSLNADLWDAPPEPVASSIDARVFGMHARLNTRPDFDPFAPLTASAPSYEVMHVNDLVVVICTDATAKRTEQRTWWLDPERGWNAVRFERSRNGRVQSQVTSELACYGSTWFPRTVKRYTSAGALLHTIQVRSFKANDASLPQQLKPQFIGIEPGTAVSHHRTDGSIETTIFDGAHLISPKEYFRQLRAGKLKEGPSVTADRAKLREHMAREHERTRHTPSMWERYVRRFVNMNGLDAAQAARAWLIYRDCKEQAERYLDARKAEFDKLEQQREALEAEEEEDAEKLAQLDKRRARLRAPVQEIFNKRLVPRLESLLTREQIRQAEKTKRRNESATTKPTQKDG